MGPMPEPSWCETSGLVRKELNPALFAVNGGRVFFEANDGSHGPKMWVSDGTETGTTLVSGTPRPESYSGGGGAVAGASIYFTTNQSGRLWRTDGTEMGTQRLHVTGNCLASSGGVVFFLHNGQTEVWRTDGTEAGTFMLQRLRRYPSAEFACPSFTDVNGRMFYLGRDVRHGHELWTSDGTVAGTTFVADLRPGRKSSYPQIVGRAEDQVIFRTAYPPVLWASDATAADTTKLQRSVYADSPNSLGGDPTLNGALFFTTAPEGADAGSELWRTDGTPQGTVMVKEDPRAPTRISRRSGAAPVADVLLFNTDDAQHGDELWMTDGTNAGTTLLKEINPGANASYPDHLVSAGGLVFFSASDGGARHRTLEERWDGLRNGHGQGHLPGDRRHEHVDYVLVR